MVEVYNQENKKIGTIELPAKIFGVRWNADLVHQAATALEGNRRQPLAHTKTRGEVRGGGRKPWRQKGTGRARHGSTRSPLWIGGGVTFGPRKEKVFAKKINKKMKQLALFSVLSKKAAAGQIKVIDNLNIKEPKTKIAAAMLRNFFGKKLPTVVFVLSGDNRNFSAAARNIPGVFSVKPAALDIYSLLTHRYVFFEKKAIDEIISHYQSK